MRTMAVTYIIYKKKDDSIHDSSRPQKNQKQSFIPFDLWYIHFIHPMILPVHFQCTILLKLIHILRNCIGALGNKST